MEPAVLDVARAALIEEVHGTVWRKSAKSIGAAGTKAHLMTDRAPVGQPEPSECEGG